MHVALYNAFDWTPPQFGHVPLLVDQNGQKLSKRNSNIDISFYRDSGILPSTLLNYAALLGWSHNQKSEVFSLKDMEEIVRCPTHQSHSTTQFFPLILVSLVHPEDHQRQHHRQPRKDVVPSKSTHQAMCSREWPRVPEISGRCHQDSGRTRKY
jgi:glutamyl/glutaminyl-tRNA synthetase